MRNSLLGLAVFSLVVASASLISARQQASPGVSPARFWINNRTREEAIPISVANVDPKSPPVPVAVNGVTFVDFTDRAAGTLSQIQGRTQSVVAAHQQWEYRELTFTPGEDRVTALNQAGAQGWEATGLTAEPNNKTAVLLKRPK